MKKIHVLLTFLFFLNIINAQHTSAFKSGEWLKYRMSYSNFINAGYAELSLKKTKRKGVELYHAKGTGKTTGVIGWFFKVRDRYESFFTKKEINPVHFVRRVNEGGHIINRDIYFDKIKKTALIKNHKKKTQKTMTANDVQDMISAVYRLRNEDLSNMKVNEDIKMKLFFDYESFDFKMRYLGNEIIKTKFGKVNCLKFRPIVQAGRVFKEEESVTIWISNDENKIPLKIKASLAVGSLRADLDGFKGLANSFNIIYKN